MATPPNVSERPLDSRGYFTKAWLAYLREIGVSGSDDEINAALAEIRGRIAALEERGAGNITGPGSVLVFGALESGVVQLTLRGDNPDPGNTYVYATDPDGVKGWYLLGDAFDTETLAKVIDPTTGVVSFDLAELPDTGIGAALVKLTRDGYGRVEGTEAAVLDDLSDVDAAAPSTGDALVFDGANWAPGQVATEQLFQRMTPEADFRITADGNLRVTT